MIISGYHRELGAFSDLMCQTILKFGGDWAFLLALDFKVLPLLTIAWSSVPPVVISFRNLMAPADYATIDNRLLTSLEGAFTQLPIPVYQGATSQGDTGPQRKPPAVFRRQRQQQIRRFRTLYGEGMSLKLTPFSSRVTFETQEKR